MCIRDSANTWDDYAKRDGYVVNNTPAVGAVFQTDVGEYGHVAYVIGVNDTTGEWRISEMNAPTINVVSTRTFSKEAVSYTHLDVYKRQQLDSLEVLDLFYSFYSPTQAKLQPLTEQALSIIHTALVQKGEAQ